MTDREKAIVMAFTGVAMLEGEKFGIFHEYIEKVCGSPIWTHELADKRVWDEIKEKSKDDFLSVCQSEDPLDRVLEIISQERDKTESVTHKTIENIISAVLSLKGGEQE